MSQKLFFWKAVTQKAKWDENKTKNHQINEVAPLGPLKSKGGLTLLIFSISRKDRIWAYFPPQLWLTFKYQQSRRFIKFKNPYFILICPGNILLQLSYVTSFSQLYGIPHVSDSFVGNPNAFSVTILRADTQKSGQKTFSKATQINTKSLHDL